MDNKFFQNNIVYQIYPRSFCDSNNDGIGDLPGIISKLDYLSSLGVGILWLSPIYPSPNKDNGYDVSDYYSINPEYGTMDDFKLLIKLAKEKGIRIVMDLVLNHTSTEHPYFIQSKDINSPYHDYYYWREGRHNNKRPPNNWQSIFTSSAWQFDISNKLYYLHLYAPQQADLNYHDRDVVEEAKKIMRYWLDLGVYGFRFDVINQIYKTSLHNGKKHFIETGHEYYQDQEGCHLLLQEFYRDVLSIYDSMSVGECYKVNIEEAKKFTNNELDMVFQFDHMNVDKSKLPLFNKKFKPSSLKKIIYKWQENIKWNANYFENHDQGRSVSRFGDMSYRDESAKALAMFLLTLKGTPFIYQGQEIGMSNYNFTNIDEINDVAAKNVYSLLRQKLHFSKHFSFKVANRINRDHARTTMQWDDSLYGGFSSHAPWIKTNPNYSEINVKNENEDIDSILSFYRKLITLRKSDQVLINGDFIPLLSHKNLIAFQREYQNITYQIIINLSNKHIRNPFYCGGEVILSNYNRQDYSTNKKLAPYECALIRVL